MELTNMELEAYEVLKDKLGISEVEFANLASVEKSEWVEAYKLAKLLYENKKDELYEGYKDTDVYCDGEFNLVECTEMVRQKKRIMDNIEKHVDFKGSLPQFILLGDKVNFELVSEGLKNINNKNVIEMETSE